MAFVGLSTNCQMLVNFYWEDVYTVDRRAHLRWSRPRMQKTRGANRGQVCASESIGRGNLTAVVLGVALGKLLPLLRQIVQSKDRRNRAHRHTCAAIDALHRIDVQHLFCRKRGRIFLRMNAIYRASIHAGGVLRVNARFCNYVCHRVYVSPGLETY